jgi:hypothetical protein
MHLQELEHPIDLAGETEASDHTMRRAEAPVSDRSDTLAKLERDFAIANHRPLIISWRPPQSALNLSLPSPKLLSNVVLHLKGPLGLFIECGNPLNTRPFR